mmetsp:Transcript_103355/g.179344  ORF Transcript_103355/g.179344 Transcript_103355/m.179344 type:complete len:242 (+) Transcript_103355:770-1495(+)
MNVGVRTPLSTWRRFVARQSITSHRVTWRLRTPLKSIQRMHQHHLAADVLLVSMAKASLCMRRTPRRWLKPAVSPVAAVEVVPVTAPAHDAAPAPPAPDVAPVDPAALADAAAAAILARAEHVSKLMLVDGQRHPHVDGPQRHVDEVRRRQDADGSQPGQILLLADDRQIITTHLRNLVGDQSVAPLSLLGLVVLPWEGSQDMLPEEDFQVHRQARATTQGRALSSTRVTARSERHRVPAV